jgi:hypothetical protein
MANPKEPFIPQADRPAVAIDPNKSVSELTVRDLQTIVGQPQILKFQKDYDKFYKEYFKEYYKEYAKDFKEYAYEKDPRIETIFTIPTQGGDPGPEGIAQLVAHVGGLHKKIDELTDQIAQLKKSK